MKLPSLTLLLCALLCISPAHAKIHRSAAARAEFERGHPCPSTGENRGPCPGYVVDHIIALACGGADTPINMQWQSTAAGRAKDRWERRGCRHRHKKYL